MRGRFRSKLRTSAWAVMLKICLGVKFTPSLTWKLNPPDMAPAGEDESCRELKETRLAGRSHMTLPLWTNSSCPLSMWAWVKLSTAAMGALFRAR